MAGLDFQQTQNQSQIQVMSQKQIQSLNLLSLSSGDLRNEILKAAEENPALFIQYDPLEQKGKFTKKTGNDFTRLSSRIGSAQQLASDNFQNALEAQPDNRASLQDHLLFQLNMTSLNPEEEGLCKKIIGNLDQRGFFILSPFSLLDKNNQAEDQLLLDKCIKVVQSFDPSGICCASTEESLLLQAQQKENAPSLALFLLNGHLDFLVPAQEEKISKKVEAFVKSQKKLFAQKEGEIFLQENDFTAEKCKEALAFIRGLDPYPARNFSVSQTHFVSPDIYVSEIGSNETYPFSNKGLLVESEKHTFLVSLSNENVPSLSLSPDFVEYTSEKNKMVDSSIKKAEEFISALNFRQQTLAKAACAIVSMQADFFAEGPGHLAPMKQQDLADILKVHETTVSRMANGKFVQCQWGLFPIKYFFSNAVSAATSLSKESSGDVSKEKVLYEMKKILEEHKNDAKKMSDQKLSDALSERGIKVARRTVAKYRSQLNIESSYLR